MAEAARPGAPPPKDGPSTEELEERWREVIDSLHERPRDPELCIKAGQLSEQLNRPLEAYTYFKKALALDPTKGFLVTRLKALATTSEQKDEVTKISRRPTSFEASLRDIFKYPVRGKGLPVLIIGAVFFWIARALANNGFSVRAGLTIGVLAAAYMAMFYIDVCHTTVGGEEELPDWPDPLRFNEFALDVGKFVGAMVAAFLPVIVLLLVFIGSLISAFSPPEEEFTRALVPAGPGVHGPVRTADDEDEAARPAPAAAPAAPAPAPPPPSPSFPTTLVLLLVGLGVFGIAGMIYLPMAKLANVVLGSPWTAFNYPFVAHSILATPRSYLVCLGMYFGISAIVGIGELVVGMANIIVFTGIGLAFVELYGMTVLMRLLGLFYRMNQARLGWMAD